MFRFLSTSKYPRYLTTEKRVGETPLIATERLREEHNLPKDIPLAYAGRLDPMASGTLVILIGEECKKQTKYHAFDKMYEIEILFGVSSDTGDVLGRLTQGKPALLTEAEIRTALTSCLGTIELPYPHFSSKTINGKPLHMWTLENRIDEIEIPVKKSTIYALTYRALRAASREEIYATVKDKIETIPQVTDPKKALGEDFRRDSVRHDWDEFTHTGREQYQILTCTCIASSGTYMRSLASHIAEKLGTSGLAYSIHRTKVGKYLPVTKKHGVWIKHLV